MRIAEVIGTLTLNRAHPSLRGGRFRLVVPMSLDNLSGASADRDEPLVAYDEQGAGIGQLVALSEGGEAAQPFHPDLKPVDAYLAAQLDRVSVEPLP